MKNNDPASFRRAEIYTLAQSETAEIHKPAVILRGTGSKINSSDYGGSKGKRKMISQIMALNLIDIAKERGKDSKSFWNAYHCQSVVRTYDGTIYGDYCKTRFCTGCTAIRKADKINSYYPVLKKWEDAHFLTLTVRSCKFDRLKIMMRAFNKAIKRIIAKYRKRNQRGYGKKLVGIRSLECNFNPERKTYNPHFHIIVPDEETADIFKREWLEIWTPKYTYEGAQDIRPVKNLERDLIETIKYGTKIFTEPKAETAQSDKVSPKIYARAYYNIIEAMQGLRIFERFGFNLPNKEKNTRPAFVTNEYEEWVYMPEYCDWQNTENEIVLTAYEPPLELLILLRSNIDVIRE